jgi:hypothetical protein
VDFVADILTARSCLTCDPLDAQAALCEPDRYFSER